MTEPILSQISMFGCNFAPRNWAWCDGRMVAISDNPSLFSLLGATFGGDGRVSFALPDLRGRAPIGLGRGPGLSNRVIGQRGGLESVMLGEEQMPSHTHLANATIESSGVLTGEATASGTIKCNQNDHNSQTPAGKVPGNAGDVRSGIYADNPSGTDEMHPGSLSINVDISQVKVNIASQLKSLVINHTGGNGAHENMQPFTVIPFSIALEGLFPPRN